MPTTNTIASATCGMTDGEDQARRGEHEGQSEQPSPRQVLRDPRAERHARSEPDEDGAEQRAVRRVPTAEAGDEDLARADHRTGGDERTDQADDEARR